MTNNVLETGAVSGALSSALSGAVDSVLQPFYKLAIVVGFLFCLVQAIALWPLLSEIFNSKLPLTTVTPTDVVLNAHKLFPFDKKINDTKLGRECELANLQGDLFYPGVGEEAMNFLTKTCAQRAFGQFHVQFKPVVPGFFEATKVLWNNRLKFDIYVNGQFVRQMTTFATHKET